MEQLQGSLDEIRVPEILHNISSKKLTGALRLTKSHQQKFIYFEEGRIVFASSNDPDERLGALLLRQNKITYRQLQEASPKVVPGKRLGTVLVIERILQPNDLYIAVIDQLKEIIFSVFDWDSGKFQFQPGPLPEKEVITLIQSTQDLIVSGMQRIWRLSWLTAALPALDTVYRKSLGWSPVVRNMNLNREMEAILDLFDRPRMLQEVLQISPLGNFETCRCIWTFLILGVVEEILVAPTWAPEEPEVATAQSTQELPKQSITDLPEPVSNTPQTVILNAPVLNPSVAEEAPVQTNLQAAYDLEPLLAEPDELSFSDLAELADQEEKTAEFPSLQAWETKVEPDLKQFNELHRYLYEMISLELGNGTNSFLSKVFKKASSKYPLVFESVPVNEFGELGESVLLENIQGNLVEDYQKALDYLMSEERSMMSLFLEMKRVDVIEAGIKRILQRQNRTSN